MAKAIIIDDEELNREALQELLKRNFPDLEIVGQAGDVRSGLELIQKSDPEIVFLDIQMPDGTGFDLLRKLKSWDFEVIFTTAHDEYALEAFHASAIGYLLKPIDEEQLQTTVARAIDLTKSRDESRRPQLEALTDNYTSGDGRIKKFVLPDSEGYQIVSIEDILYLQGDRNYTRIVFEKHSPVLSSFNLGWFEKLLAEQHFFRISKSHLINLKKASRYTKGDGGRVVVANGEQLPIAVNKRDEMRQYFL